MDRLLMIIDMQTLITAGAGTALAIGFGIQPMQNALSIFGFITAEEIIRKNLVPIITDRIRNDKGLLKQTPVTVRRPSNADVMAFGMQF